MVVVERRTRRGPVLTASSLPCLDKMPTINVTEGCSHGCKYCYIQGYSNYPGPGRVILFENTPRLVREELSRKRQRPRRVYFSPSSDAFQPLPEVRQVTHETMACLLAAGVEVAFLTKGIVGEPFLALFAKSPSLVFAQIGITTLDERLWRTFEPGAAAPAQRLDAVENLMRIGIQTQARLDPLISDLTDTESNLVPLLSELERRKVRDIAASFLFLRPAFAEHLREGCTRLSNLQIGAGWCWQSMAEGLGSGQMMEADERRRRFSLLEGLAAKHGIAVHVCTCKNPDLGSPRCGIAGPPLQSPQVVALPLFAPDR